MGKKRRGEDQRQSDSEIRHKCLQNGSSSSQMSPEDIPRETSLESILQQMAHGLSMTTEILREMQDKDEKFRKTEDKSVDIEKKYEKKFKEMEEKNEQKFKEMEEKNEKKIKEMEEKNEMKFKEMEEMNEKKFKEMEEELEKQNNECKVMKKELEELKDGAVARSSGYASPAQRTEPDYSLQPRLNLKILSEMKDKSYKGKIIRTKTMDCVEVGLFDGDNPISHDHHLSSAKVKLVILKEEFYKDGEDYWSKEDFMQALKRHGDRNTAMRIEKCTFNLTSGYARHPGAIILDNSNRKAVRLGVMIMGPCKERVLEGISNPFKVQEAKTDKKKPEDGITADNGLQQQAPMNNRSQPTTTQPASENGEEGITADNGEQQQDPMNNRSHHTIAQSASENGNILAANRQKQMYLPDPTNKWLLSAIARSAEDGQGIGGCYQQNSMYMSHDTAITCNGHGESFQTPQDFGQPHNSFMPEIWGGDDTLFMLPGFQTQSTSDPERTEYAGDLHPQTQNQVIPYVQSGNGGSIILNRVQLQFDEPNVEPRQWWNILDKLMPLFPDKRLVHEYDRLFASDYFRKTMMRVHGTMGIANRGMQHHNRGVLIQCLEDSDSEHEPPIKTKRQASYQLRFVNKACREYYVWGQIKAEDGGLLKVALYNDDSLRITSGPLSSASVEIVLLHGDFNADGQDYWSADKFGNYILCPLSEEPPALGGDCVLTLVDGEASLSCACFQKTSSFARTGKFTMGVKMKTTLEERVQEGITQPFLVQVRQDEDSNYTCRPSGLAGGLTKLSEEVSTSPDRGSLMRRTGSSFSTEQDKVTRLHPGYEEVICIKSEPRQPEIDPGQDVPASQPPARALGDDVPAPLALQPAMAPGQQPWEYTLRKYLLLLATLVATVTYDAGFNPPGGVWQEGARDDGQGQLAGDPVIRHTHYGRYLAFFYCNSTAFAASLVVIVLILILAVRHDKEKEKKDSPWVTSDVVLLRGFMVLDLLSLVGAYVAGTCRDKVSTVYSVVLVAAVFLYIAITKLLDWWFQGSSSNAGSGSGGATSTTNTSDPDSVSGAVPRVQEKEDLKKLKAEERLRKVLMLLATFAVSITYVAGLSTPGGFWDNTAGSHRPGDAILKDHHGVRLMVFLLCNTTAFVASLFITMLLIIDGKKLREKTAWSLELALYVCIGIALVSLVIAYAAGSCRHTDTTVCVLSLIGGVLAYIVLHAFFTSKSQSSSPSSSPAQETDENQNQQTDDNVREALDKARSLVLLLATLAATITYTAGLNPPGGLWQENGDGHMAGDPILLTTDNRRYRAFFYCNSVAFVASLVAIVLVQKEVLVKHHVLEAAMILDLFGLIGAYAAGSCRDVNHSIYAMALAGAVLVYVVIHVIFFTLDHKDKDNDYQDQLLEKRRKRLLLFAILAATITYQAGLTPPGGFLLQDDELGHHAGDPVLLYNYPRRYNAFFYCNSVSFMLSIALILLLVNPNLYRPAIRSNALSVCTAVGLFCLMGAYAAGSTQHIRTSIYIFVLVAVVLFVAAGVLLVFLMKEINSNGNLTAASPIDEEQKKKKEDERKEGEKERKKHARRKYLMLLGILVASVAYQAGLEPPGGAWQSSGNGHEAGDLVMHDNRRPRYLVFFYSNSISFMASIVVIIMLIPQWLPNMKEVEWSLRVMSRTIILDLLALLLSYAAGSSRGWKTSVYVVTLIFAVLGYFAIHMTLSFCSDRRRPGRRLSSQESPPV